MMGCRSSRRAPSSWRRSRICQAASKRRSRPTHASHRTYRTRRPIAPIARPSHPVSPRSASRSWNAFSTPFTRTARRRRSKILLCASLLATRSRLATPSFDRLSLAADLDGLVVTHLPNVFYLTNFLGTAGIAVAMRDRLYLILDFRYASAAKEIWDTPYGCPDAEIVPVDRTYDETLVALIKRLQPKRLGIEGNNVSVNARHQLTTQPRTLQTRAASRLD